MAERPRLQVLQDLRTRYGGRLSRCNMHDPNVSTSSLDWADALKPGPPPPDRFVQQLKFRYAARPVVIYGSRLCLSVRLLADIGINFTFSINRVDRLMPEPSPAPAWPTQRWPVFVYGDARGAAARFLSTPQLMRAIDALNLSADESLHVYRNAVDIYTSSTIASRVEELLEGAGALADALPRARLHRTDYSSVPEIFRSLVPLLEKWSQSDDDDRAERLARSSRAELTKFVAAVEPHFESINRYLDGFGDKSMPESATALGALAEAAAEAQILLQLSRGHARRARKK